MHRYTYIHVYIHAYIHTLLNPHNSTQMVPAMVAVLLITHPSVLGSPGKDTYSQPYILISVKQLNGWATSKSSCA